MPERYAIFYAPATQSPLWQRAAQWLGRDAAGGDLPFADIPGISAARRIELTQSARRYGFHGTIKAPTSLPAGQSAEELEAALTAFTLIRRPVPIGPVEVRLLGDFLALMPVTQPQALTDFAAETTLAFEPFRAPLGTPDRDRRLELGLTERQIELLDRYGYPYVLEQFLFHMTIGDRLLDTDRDAMVAAARAWFAPILQMPVTIDRLTLFHEHPNGTPFVRLGDFPLLSQAHL